MPSWKSVLGCCCMILGLAGNRSATAGVSEGLRVMTFNVWSGEETAAGRAKLVEIMQAAAADIIGVQELSSAYLQSLANALGFYAHRQSGGDIQVLSRFPILESSPGGLGVRIAVSPQQDVWLFNAHLAAYPYQPYDLRDGVLPQDETAVIAAADAARGSQVTQYLQDIAAVGATQPIFFTGDFNEPSHLDWTQAAADATDRPFDLEVEYPTSRRITDAGFVDAFRAVRPDEVHDRGETWTPGYPPPLLSADEVHDRIDIIYSRGAGVHATAALTVGLDPTDPNTDLAVPGYHADHRAVVAEFTLPACSLFADLTGNCVLDLADWLELRTHQHTDLHGLSAAEAYARGDLNGDYANNHEDFVLFKRAFIDLHGAAAFDALARGVPEPSGAVLLSCAIAVAGCYQLVWGRDGANRRL